MYWRKRWPALIRNMFVSYVVCLSCYMRLCAWRRARANVEHAHFVDDYSCISEWAWQRATLNVVCVVRAHGFAVPRVRAWPRRAARLFCFVSIFAQMDCDDPPLLCLAPQPKIVTSQHVRCQHLSLLHMFLGRIPNKMVDTLGTPTTWWGSRIR